MSITSIIAGFSVIIVLLLVKEVVGGEVVVDKFVRSALDLSSSTSLSTTNQYYDITFSSSAVDME